MKINTYIKESREALVDALKHINDLKRDEQHSALLYLTAAIKELSKLQDVIDKAKKEKTSIDFNKSYQEIWDGMNKTDYKLMVLRLEPQEIKGTKISGYLRTFHLPTTIPDIIEEIGKDHGGGKYQIRILDDAGKYIKSKTFEIAGIAKIPEKNE